MGYLQLIFAGHAHGSVVSCRVLWGMTGLRWLGWVAHLCFTWPVILHQASLGLIQMAVVTGDPRSASGRGHAKLLPEFSRAS